MRACTHHPELDGGSIAENAPSWRYLTSIWSSISQIALILQSRQIPRHLARLFQEVFGFCCFIASCPDAGVWIDSSVVQRRFCRWTWSPPRPWRLHREAQSVKPENRRRFVNRILITDKIQLLTELLTKSYSQVFVFWRKMVRRLLLQWELAKQRSCRKKPTPRTPNIGNWRVHGELATMSIDTSG